MNHAYIDKLAFIYIKDKKVLTTLTRGKDTWYIPGGKREEGETDHQALMREVAEELSVELKPETIRHYGTFEAQAHGKPEGTMVRMTCYMAEFNGHLTPAAEIERMDFIDHEGKAISSPADGLIIDELFSKGLIA